MRSGGRLRQSTGKAARAALVVSKLVSVGGCLYVGAYGYAILQFEATELQWGEEFWNLRAAIQHSDRSSGWWILLGSEVRDLQP